MKNLDTTCFLVNEKGPSKWDKCFCVATAAGVATAVGAVASAGTAIYSASQTPDAGGGGGRDLYGSNPELPNFESKVNLPQFDARAGAKDYKAMMPDLARLASGGTTWGIKMRDKVMPGSSRLMSQASDILLQLSQGIVPSDVVNQTNQLVAERMGGAHVIGPSSGPDQAQTDFARNIGQTSQQQVDRFLSAAPTWEQLADQFAYTPQEALQDAMGLLAQRYNYTLGAAAVQNDIDENVYTAELNKARGAAMPDPGVVGARNDALIQQAMQGISGGSSNYLTAIGGAVSGIGGILQNYQSTYRPNSSGFYSSADAAIRAGGSGSTAAYSAGAGGPAGGGGYYISGYR